MISAFSRLVKLSTVILPDRDVNSRGVFYSSLNLPFVIGTIALQRICKFAMHLPWDCGGFNKG